MPKTGERRPKNRLEGGSLGPLPIPDGARLRNELETCWIVSGMIPSVARILRDAIGDKVAVIGGPVSGGREALCRVGGLEDEFRESLARRDVSGLAAVAGGAVVGALFYRMRKESLEVTLFGVAPGARRQGVGRALIARAEESLRRSRRRLAESILPEDNLDAHLFLKGCGWECSGLILSEADVPSVRFYTTSSFGSR